MSSVFVEERIELTFDDDWQVIAQWDKERAFLDGIRKLQTTHAVDFCGIRDSGSLGSALYLIELKDFRGHRIENKGRFKDEPACPECGQLRPGLFQEVGLKVRDTLAGLVSAAHRRGTERGRWDAMAKTLARAESPIQVILWLEEDRGGGPTSPARSSVLVDNLKKHLGWLTSRVTVASSERPPPGVTARHLRA